MANTQTDEFIKTVTANRAQLAKAGHYKEAWFYERRPSEGARERYRGGGGRRTIGWALRKGVLSELMR